MAEIFRSYWWLLFPLAAFIGGGFNQWMRYRQHRDTLDLIKSYNASGREPPPELVARLHPPEVDYDRYDDREARRQRRYDRRRYRYGFYHNSWSRVVLFGVLAIGFGAAAIQDIYEAGPAFIIVTVVMVALCLSSLVGVLMTPKNDD